LTSINPNIVVHPLVQFVTLKNLAELLDGGFDAVIDACDALRIKVEMIAFCKRRKIPIVVSGSAGGRADPTLITARDLTRTEHDILLGLVRRRLRDDFGWTRNPKRYFGVQAVFSRENVNYPQSDGSVCKTRAPDVETGLKLDCGGGLGAAMHVTATFGMVAASRVIDRLLEAVRSCALSRRRFLRLRHHVNPRSSRKHRQGAPARCDVLDDRTTVDPASRFRAEEIRSAWT
jgi:tRNA A37 threonylcarbamoyladenosine dehydratase